MKALQGIKMSYRLQDILQTDANNGIIRGLRNPDNNCTSLNAFLYSILRSNRSHRRALLTTLLNHLDDSAVSIRVLVENYVLRLFKSHTGSSGGVRECPRARHFRAQLSTAETQERHE